MNENTVYKAVLQAMERASSVIPVDTGNLRYNSVKLRQVGKGHFQIYIDESIAPYAPYTTEQWTSPKWNGQPNPNEGWWDNYCTTIMNELTKILGGELKSA